MTKQIAELPIQNIIYFLRNRIIVIYEDDIKKECHKYCLRSSTTKPSPKHNYNLRPRK